MLAFFLSQGLHVDYATKSQAYLKKDHGKRCFQRTIFNFKSVATKKDPECTERKKQSLHNQMLKVRQD